ncbi:MAG: stage III sporulation protein AB [Oscillospiraceae bacterium]|nr:stage III sporulation protein AB [Oscillospiraceae bacterium]
MELKWIGAVLVMAGCGAFGFSLAAAHRREEGLLRQLLKVISFMECELQYRLTPLPQLCRNAAKLAGGPLRALLQGLARELEFQAAPDAPSCMAAALAQVPELPKSSRAVCRQLGQTLGQFDLPGQLKGLEGAEEACRRALDVLEKGRDARLRSYQTLALCAGAALTILFL